MIRHRVRGHRKELTVWAERVTRRRRKTITATTKTRPASASTTARRMTGGVRPAAQTTASTSIPQTNSDAAITAVACKNSRARWERCHLSSCSADATGSLTIGSPVPCPGEASRNRNRFISALCPDWSLVTVRSTGNVAVAGGAAGCPGCCRSRQPAALGVALAAEQLVVTHVTPPTVILLGNAL